MKEENGKRNKMFTAKESQPVRVETISDTYGHHKHYRIGTMPAGGFQAVWRFEDNQDTKNSSSSFPGGKKVY
jgi:hypothetical protein